ncbi:MAG: acyl-phosphate glycerol 3-phosphate acyltransferase [Chloroflexi bacterium]|nr:acyl-phosphate glycerol 3-phosphate acyltransferase [Chloroflexota bacterium]
MDFEYVLAFLLACLVSYIFGALPFADKISKRKGVDIFQIGTGLAGASNVLKSVGKGSALIVLVFDIAKGALAISVANAMGIDGVLVLVPAAFAIFGHWNSIFTGFKGGDGMAIMGGLAIALFGTVAIIAMLSAGMVSLLAQRLPFSSLTSIIAGYTTIVLVCLYLGDKVDIAVWFGAICLLVLFHALVGHSRRNRSVLSEIDA